MGDLAEKLIKIFIGEVAVGIFFVMIILILSSIAQELTAVQEFISAVVWMWVLSGIATPVVIFFELETALIEIIKSIK